MSIDLCTYNIRGLNNKQEFLKKFIGSNNISFVAVLETHVHKDQSLAISHNISPGYSWVFNYDQHDNGRIWVGFDSSIWKFDTLSVSAQHITGMVHKLASGEQFVVSFVYGFNTGQERRTLWRDLGTVNSTLVRSNAWSIMGDFNVCLGPGETNKGSMWTRNMLDFREFLTREGLVDLNSSGPEFTWWDSCKSDPCFKKLDRCIVNGQWISNFALSFARILPRGLSDHSPIVVSLGKVQDRLKKPFQFFVHLIAAPGFMEAVSEAWEKEVRGDPWFVLTMKLRRVKEAMRKLNTARGNIHKKVEAANIALLDFQLHLPLCPTIQQFDEEERLRKELLAQLKSEEVFLRQKSRVNWLKCGDGNNKYFFNACKGRWNTNKIMRLDDELGVSYSSHKDISRVAVDYFQKLMGKEEVVDDFPENVSLPQLNDDQKNLLMGSFNALDIVDTLKSMAKGKCPGPDGFPVEFYLATWSVVGVDVTNAVLHFFNNFHLPRIINSSVFALVPKSQPATSMSD